MGMTEQELRTKVLELLATGVYSKSYIKDALWVESDRKMDNMLKSLLRDGLIKYDPSKKGYTIKKTFVHEKKKVRTKKVVPVKHTLSIKFLRVIFGLLSVGASAVSIRNTSRYLIESYPVVWGFTISILMSIFMVSAASMMVYFFQRKKIAPGSGLFILWAIVTVYSMASTSIGMYNAQKEMFVERIVYDKATTTQNTILEEYNKQIEGTQVLIDDKKETLDRLKSDLRKFEEGSSNYKNTVWYIEVAERFINTKQAEMNTVIDKRIALMEKDKDVETAQVRAKTFYEEMEGLFGVKAALIQFVLSLCASIFIDIIAPIGASMALFLKEE